MSFETMKVAELRKVAETFGIDIEPKSSKDAIVSALEEEGVTYDMYAKFSGAEKEESDDKPSKTVKQKLTRENTVLVRMDRANPSFSIGRFTFTQEHPFLPMTEEDAQHIFDTQDGFRLATPREVNEFYS